MQSTSKKIMNKIRKSRRGYVFTPRDFMDFGSRQAVDTALSRLVAQGGVRRLARGLYDFPRKHKLLGDLFPSFDDVAKVISRDADSTIQISGARALYLLGLTTQVPAQTVYLTNGRSRDIKIGGAVLKLRHASSRIMAGAGSKAGTILQAIRYLGKQGLTDHIINMLAQQLDDKTRKALKMIARYAPDWTKLSIDRVICQ